MVVSRPVAPATWRASPTPTPSGKLRIRTRTAAPTPPTITTICFTSAQVTACTPPNMVYSVVGTPMARAVKTRLHPSTIDSTTAGAETMTPTARPREIRNNSPASARVFASNRRSRYSYAVNTFAR